jgi:hypothetical protein
VATRWVAWIRPISSFETSRKSSSPEALLDSRELRRRLYRAGDLGHLDEEGHAVIVLDPDSGTRVVAVVPWPGQTVDATGCLDAISDEFGPSVATTVVVLPMDWIPLTEQGKPNRPQIHRLARELARSPSSS